MSNRRLLTDACAIALISASAMAAVAQESNEPFTRAFGWPQFHRGGGNDRGHAVVTGSDGKVYVAGRSTGSSGTADMTVWVETEAVLCTLAMALETELVEGPVSEVLSDTFLVCGIELSDDSEVHVVANGEEWRIDDPPADRAYWIRKGTAELEVFGDDVVVRLTDHDAAGGHGEDVGTGMVADTTGNLYVVGYSRGPGSRSRDMVIWKVNSAGGLDADFGEGRPVVSGLEGNDVGWAIALDSAGNILVAGRSTNAETEDVVMTVWKYDVSGQGGVIFTDHGAAGRDGYDEAYAMAVDDQDNIYLAGKSTGGDGTYDMVVWKILWDDGDAVWKRDPNFGDDGVACDPDVLPGPGNDEGFGIARKDTGSIFVTGRTDGDGDFDMVIWKYLPDGQLDTGFGTGGVVKSDPFAEGSGLDWGNAIAVKRDSVYVAGTSSSTGTNDLVIWWYDGVRGDPLYTVVYPDATNDTLGDWGNAAALSDDGAILVAGSRGQNPNHNMAVWKFDHTDLIVHVGGEILPPESIADRVDLTSPASAVIEPVDLEVDSEDVAFHHPKVFWNETDGWEGRWFANEAASVKITWMDKDSGLPVPNGELLPYEIKPTLAENQWVVPVDLFQDYPSAHVRLETSYELTIRYNSTVRDHAGEVPPLGDIHVVADVVTVEPTCPSEGTIIFQYDSGPTDGHLVGFEVVRISNEGTPSPDAVPVGRRLLIPEQADNCKAVLITNAVEQDTKAAWQRGTDTVDIYPIRPDSNPADLVAAWYRSTPLGNCWPTEIHRYTADWPTADLPQIHVIDADAPEPPDGSRIDLRVGKLYQSAALVFQVGFQATDPPPDAVIGGDGFFQASNPGYSVIKFNISNSSNVTFEVVASYDNKDAANVFDGQVNWEIGTQVEDPGHDPATPDYPHGYLKAGQPYAPDFYEPLLPDGSQNPTFTRQIIPVNSSDVHGNLEVWWYEAGRATEGGNFAEGIFWPYKVVDYNAVWPGTPEEIVIASRLGAGAYTEQAEVLKHGEFGANDQFTLPGWNPDDEHAILLTIAGAYRAFAVRDDNPWQVSSGHPYVLVKYPDPSPGHPDLWNIDVYQVVGEDASYSFDYTDYVSQGDGYTLLPVVAGLPVIPLFPVNPGATPVCDDGIIPPLPLTQVVGDAAWVDRKGGIWGVEETDDETGSPASADIFLWENWAPDRGCQPWRAFADYGGSIPVEVTGECVGGGSDGNQCHTNTDCMDGECHKPYPITYRPSWPATHMCSGGLHDGLKCASGDDCPEGDCLPCNWPTETTCARPLQIGERVDQSGQCGSIEVLHDSVGSRIIDPTRWVSVEYPDLPPEVNLKALPPHLYEGEIPGGGGQWPNRVRYGANGSFDLEFRGVMTDRDRVFLEGLSDEGTYVAKIGELYDLSRQQLTSPLTDAVEKWVTVGDVDAEPGWITLGFQNDQACVDEGLPISVEVWRVDCPPYRGSIRAIQPRCPFSEKLVLQFSGDLGGEPENLVFQWQWATGPDGPWEDYFPESDRPWSLGRGLREVLIEGASPFTIADTYWRVRYRGYPNCPGDINPDPGTEWPHWLDGGGPTSTQISEWTDVQLAEGWIKRVVRALNPFDQRIDDFHNNPVSTYVDMISQAGIRYEAPIAMNCNPDYLDSLGLIEIYETVLNRAREFSIDIGISYAPANHGIMLAAGKIADLYVLLGNEAFADALDPTIGLFAEQGEPPQSYDPHAVFCFEDQVPSLLEEELALLRGRDVVRPPDTDADGRILATVYNRLPWNFTSGDGQVAYANNYQVTDVADLDPDCGTPGHAACSGARDLFPQGHGDAWGHYLTAVKKFYALLRHPGFSWVVESESVLVAGQPVEVGFKYERKFARAAAAKARTGAAITALTFRERYTSDATEQDGYPDVDEQRAWGMGEWARRAGEGAYFDWVMANALLDHNDDDPEHAGTIKRIDRSTVRELSEIPAAYTEIQSIMDYADAGLNPLGLAANVVPFGLDPGEIEQCKTHFDQVFERAVGALSGAVALFDYANNNTHRLRLLRDKVEEFDRLVEERELDYTARLIEIFGKPYPEDLGLGGSYPAAYRGPDLYHFAYVDPSELIGLDNSSARTTIRVTVNEPEVDPVSGVISWSDRTVDFYVSTDGLGLVKPEDWSSRPEPGEIQFARSELLQAVGRHKQAVDRYEAQLDQIEVQADLLESLYELNRFRLQVMHLGSGLQQSLNDQILNARRQQLRFRRHANDAIVVSNAMAEALPALAIFGATTAGGDFTSAVRSAIRLAGAAIARQQNEAADNASLIELQRQQDKERASTEQQIVITGAENVYQAEQAVANLRQLVRTLPAMRLDLYILEEAINQATGRYHAAMGRGMRLWEQRTSFRRYAADHIREDRYRDMAFHVFRNDALQKYRAQFDLAAQYVYQAARAYDYETNLLGANPVSGRRFLTGIIKERTLGVVDGGIPMIGNGLAGQLAQMWTNFDLVLRPQLGLCSPDEMDRTFSLRWELFRVPNSVAYDSDWQQILSSYAIEDLNQLQEYQQYCKPLQPATLPNPAIVIPFRTTVQSGLNFFGWASTADEIYPSTYFAIKLDEVGIRFSNYPNPPLNNSAEVYLLPVGADVMRVPTDGSTRDWHLLDQVLPVPFPLGDEVGDDLWIPFDSLTGGSAAIIKRRLLPTITARSTQADPTQDLRYLLLGRSVWNTRWLLIIPGSELMGLDPNAAIDIFINGTSGSGVRDIRLLFNSYGYRGFARSGDAGSENAGVEATENAVSRNPEEGYK